VVRDGNGDPLPDDLAIAQAQPAAWDAARPDENILAQTIYDAASNVQKTIANNGRVTYTCYDSLNRAVKTVQNPSVTDPCGTYTTSGDPDKDIVQSTEYDEVGNVKKTVDNLGRVTYNCYDTLNRAVKTVQNPTVADPCGTYIPSGDVDQDITTRMVYDEVGSAIATIDAGGIITRTYYDALSRPVIVVQNLVVLDGSGDPLPPDQAIAASAPPLYDPQHPDWNIGSQSFFDALGRVYKRLDLTTSRADWTCFDGVGRVTRTVLNATGNGLPGTSAYPCGSFYSTSNLPDRDIVTEMVYDAAGRHMATIAPEDFVVSRTYYDRADRRIAATANLVARDNGGAILPIAEAIVLPTPPLYSTSYPEENLTSRWTYDVLGRVVTATTSVGSARERIDWTCYDALGRTVRTVSNASAPNACNGSYAPSGQPDEDVITRTFYDAGGNVMATMDTATRITRAYYDGLDRPLVVVNNLVVLDGNGDPLPTEQAIAQTTPPTYLTTSPDRNVRQTTRYDKAGRAFESVDNADIVTHANYDLLDRSTEVIVNFVVGGPNDNETNLTTQTQYDKRGNVIRRVDANAIVNNFAYGVTAYEYDGLSRLTAVIENFKPLSPANTETNVRTEYRYDSHGNRTAIRDANAVLNNTQDKTIFAYDALDRLTSETDALNHVTSYEYTKIGQRVNMQDANGATTSYEYDPLRRETSIQYSGANFTPDTYFQYDAAGNRTQMADGQPTVTRWTYDGLYRPTQIEAPFGQVNYGYDSLGNRTSLTYPGATPRPQVQYV
jgi:YD repeat-containing protein